MTYHYKVLGMGGEVEQRGDLVDLLNAIPYFLDKYVPPLAVINTVLKRGEADAGMSGGASWDPFTLSSEEYEMLTQTLEARGLAALECPDWVITWMDWMIWRYEVDKGVPAIQHRELQSVCTALERRLEQAERDGDSEAAGRLHLELYEAHQQVNAYIDSFRK